MECSPKLEQITFKDLSFEAVKSACLSMLTKGVVIKYLSWGGGGLSRHLIQTKRMAGDEICVRMIRLSDAALVLPLKIIFINCLNKGVFPEIWKYTNVVPVHKKKREKCE